MFFLLCASVLLSFFCLLMSWRNNIIYKIRMKAINTVDEKSKKAIEKGQDWTIYFDRYSSCGGYLKMLFDLKKWKYKDFYPDI